MRKRIRRNRAKMLGQLEQSFARDARRGHPTKQFPLVLVGVPIDIHDDVVAQAFASIDELAEISELVDERSVEKHVTQIVRQSGPFQWSRVVRYKQMRYHAGSDWIVLSGTTDWPASRAIEAERAVRRVARSLIGQLRLDTSVR